MDKCIVWSNVLVSFSTLISAQTVYCLSPLESAWVHLHLVQKVCEVLGVNYNVRAPSTRIHGQANATHTRFQLSTRICKSVGFKRKYSRMMQFQRKGFKGFVWTEEGSCEGKHRLKNIIIIIIVIIIMIIIITIIINTKCVLFYFIDNNKYNIYHKKAFQWIKIY